MIDFPTISRNQNQGCHLCSRSVGVELVEPLCLTNGDVLTLKLPYCWLHYRRLIEGIEAVNAFNKKLADETERTRRKAKMAVLEDDVKSGRIANRSGADERRPDEEIPF